MSDNPVDAGYAELNGSTNDIDWDDPIWWTFKCDCHGQTFPKQADLTRHINKETGRYRCPTLDCLKAFGTHNDLKRHCRDVHQATLEGEPLDRYPCPFPTCNRHKKGFPRPKNLQNHLASFHEGMPLPEIPHPELPATVPLPNAPAEGVPGPSNFGMMLPPAPAGTVAPIDTMVPSFAPASSSLSMEMATPVPALPMPMPVQIPMQMPPPPPTPPSANIPDDENDEVLEVFQADMTELRQNMATLKRQVKSLTTQYGGLEEQERRLKDRIEKRRTVLAGRRRDLRHKPRV